MKLKRFFTTGGNVSAERISELEDRVRSLEQGSNARSSEYSPQPGDELPGPHGPKADLAAMADCYGRQQNAEAINKEALEILAGEIHRQPRDLLDAARIAANQIAEQREELRDWRVLPDLPDRTLVEDNTIDAYRTQLVDAHRRIKELEQHLYVTSKPAPPKG